jgi:hypothetical protein
MESTIASNSPLCTQGVTARPGPGIPRNRPPQDSIWSREMPKWPQMMSISSPARPVFTRMGSLRSPTWPRSVMLDSARTAIPSQAGSQIWAIRRRPGQDSSFA